MTFRLLQTACVAAMVFASSIVEIRGQEMLTNDAVSKMVQGGLSESVILLKIQTSPGRYDVDTDALLRLKSQGASDRILQALIENHKAAPRAESGTARAERNSNPAGYELLAANRTSTMEKEMNGTALSGYEFAGLTFGETALGGNEVIVGMKKIAEPLYEYKLLATNKTSTMEKEINQAATLGFRFRESSYGETAGGAELLVVMERRRNGASPVYRYKLLATTKTSTLRKEINAISQEGFRVADLTHGITTFGGLEVIAVMELEVPQ